MYTGIQVQIKIYGSNWVKGHRGQRSNLCFFSVCSSQVLGPIFTKLGGKVEGGPGYKLEGFIFKGQGHRGQRSNFSISAVLGPICMKLGECIQVDP